MVISRVTVNGKEINFEYKDYQVELVPKEQGDLRELRTLTAYRVKAWETSQREGELRVFLSPEHTSASLLTVCVYFGITRSSGGVFFYLPDEAAELSLLSPHMFTHGRYGESSHVFPCINTPSARCPFTVVVRVDKELNVVCSGSREVPLEMDDKRTMAHTFTTGKASCAARDIFIAVGPFQEVPDATLPTRLTHYCLPHFQAQCEVTTKVLAKAHQFFSTALGVDCPVPVFQSVFIEMPVALACGYHGTGVFADYLLYTEDILDQRLESDYLLAVALAEQWVSQVMQVNSWTDLWITQGLSHYLGALFMRTHAGSNNTQWMILEEEEALFKMPREVVMRPLKPDHLGHAAEMFHPYVVKKSFLVMCMIERRVGMAQFAPSVLPQLFSRPGVVDTQSFVNRIADLSQHAMMDIVQFWVKKGGFPVLHCGFAWNQKRHYLEFALKQDLSLAQFSGILPVRVYELDNVYNHEITFSDSKAYAWDDFPVHTRPAHKKKKRQKKGEEGGEGEGDAPTTATGAMIAEVKSNDDQDKSPILYLHIDPEQQWIMKVTFYQPEEMWINMLDSTSDKSIIAERDAVLGLRSYRTVTSIERLVALLNDDDVYCRVRCEAAHALAALAGPETQWQAAAALVNYIKEMHYDAQTLKPNKWKDAHTYEVSKAVVEALAEIKGENGFAYEPAARLLVDMLRNNDNATNIYSDHAWVMALLMAVGHLRPSMPALVGAIQEQLTRYSKLAELVPSYHSSIYLATLYCRCETLLSDSNNNNSNNNKAVVPDLAVFRHAFKLGDNLWTVRAAAAECMMRVALKRYTQANALTIVNELLDYVEGPNGHRMLQIRVLEVMASAVRARNRQLQLEDDATATRLFSEAGNAGHRALMDRVWGLVCGAVSAFDESLRGAATLLYAALWSLDTPPQAGPPRPGLVLTSKTTVDIVPTVLKRPESSAALTWRDAIRSTDGNTNIKQEGEPDQKKSKAE